MKLEKTSRVQFLGEAGACGAVQAANITLTSSAWPYGSSHAGQARTLPGDPEFRKILGRWGVAERDPLHIGFEFLLARPDSYPLFKETFQFCGWDAVGHARDWET